MIDCTFYILMRTDMNSLNPGKAMAQASHAYPAMLHDLDKIFHVSIFHGMLESWRRQSKQGFGRTVVLAAYPKEIDRIIYGKVAQYPDVFGRWVVDPTYPVRDGDTTHLIELKTCAYVFGPTDRAMVALGHLPLHP